MGLKRRSHCVWSLRALGVGAVTGYCFALQYEFGEEWSGEEVPVAAVRHEMIVFGAVTAHGMQMNAFVCLCIRFAAKERP